MKLQPLKIGAVWATAALAALGLAAAPAHAQGFGRMSGRGQVHWRGIVDNTAIIYIHGTNVQTTTSKGKGTSNIAVNSVGRLPRRAVSVFLAEQRGRGRITVIQQPRYSNDFTAAVQIYDPQGGAARYSFTADWQARQPRRGYGRRFY